MVQVRVRMLVRVRVLLRFGGVPSKRRIVRVGSMIVIIGGVGTIITPIVEGVGGIIVQEGGVGGGGGGSVLVAAGGRRQVGSNEAGKSQLELCRYRGMYSGITVGYYFGGRYPTRLVWIWGLLVGRPAIVDRTGPTPNS